MTGPQEYEPELGQAVFGQPHQKFDAPELCEAALRHIVDELTRVRWNLNQRWPDDPLANSGPGGNFKCEAFEVQAYSWSDEEQPFNFKWRDVEISWYKWVGRGMSCNRELTPDLINEMMDDCLAALRAWENAESD